mmetsp:Transcript_22838/g.41039  ORF Transcript_22838/g.41039 Transcript_22838/m.41039 type:complete len:147 (-) Transcript_22838:506-946(-)
MCAISTPLIGRFIDKKGHRTHLILISTVVITLGHLSLVLMPDCSGCYWGTIGLTLLRIGFSIYGATIWASVPLTVLAKTQGTAFGVTSSAVSIGMASGPVGIGALVDNTSQQHGFISASIFLICLGTVAAFLACLLFCADNKEGRV